MRAAWVQPFAESYRSARERTLAALRRADEAGFARATGNEGWTVRDEFVHIAASDADFSRTLGGILDGVAVDMTIFADIDDRNARNLAARANRTPAQILADLEASGPAIQSLLARLTDADEARQPDGMPFPLRGLIEGYGMHEAYHAGQIEAALGSLESRT